MRRTAILALGALLWLTPHVHAKSVWMDAQAAYVLGLRYEHGEGMTRDYARAFEMYCDADRLGHAGATFNIGWMYANGRGVARDDAQAAAWLKRAELRGNPQAERLLKVIHGGGKPVQPMCPAKPGAPPSVLAVDASVTAEIVQLVRTMAPFYHVDPDLALAVIRVESAFRANAISPANAQGLMQLIPQTAARFGVTDPLDPIANLHAGLSYLAWLLNYFGGDVKLALAGYNAGEQAVNRYRGVPPFPETRNYIKKISEIYPAMLRPQPKHPARPRSIS